MVTDFLLAGVTIALGMKLVQRWQSGRQRAVWAMSGTFLWLALAALAGGVWHGLVAYIGDAGQHAMWTITVYSIGLADAFLLVAIVFAVAPVAARRILLVLVGLKLALYLAWVTFVDADFRYVIYDYVPSLIIVFAGAIALHLRSRGTDGPGRAAAPSAGLPLAGGVAVSFAAAAIQLSGWGLHTHFNNNDIYHVVQILGMVLFYRGGCRLTDVRTA